MATLEAMLAIGGAGWPGVNAQDRRGWSALMIAVKEGRKDCAQLLFRHGADPNLRDAVRTYKYVCLCPSLYIFTCCCTYVCVCLPFFLFIFYMLSFLLVVLFCFGGGQRVSSHCFTWVGRWIVVRVYVQHTSVHRQIDSSSG